jgi:S1-C subfamily serine protease
MIARRDLQKLAAALEGVAVLGVLPGTPAAEAGVRYGDVVLAVNGVRVRTLADYVEAKDLRPDGMEVVVFRSGDERTICLAYEPDRPAPDVPALVAALAEARLGVVDPLADDGRPSDDEPDRS